MINGIDSYGSYMSYQHSIGMQQSRDPSGMFTKVDTDESGGISQTELETFAEEISGITGETIDTEDAISTYDTDGDGELSSEELRAFLDASGLQPPQRQGMPQGPPPAGGMFSDADSDESGGISQTELETLAETLYERSGETVATEDAVATYDIDGDGELSSEELQAFLDASGLQPPKGFMQQAMSAYSLYSESNETSTLLDFLSADGGMYNPFSIFA